MYCLSGSIGVQCRNPEESFQLKPGERCEVEVGRVHRVVNESHQRATYLLVQGVGNYDFNIVNS